MFSRLCSPNGCSDISNSVRMFIQCTIERTDLSPYTTMRLVRPIFVMDDALRVSVDSVLDSSVYVRSEESDQTAEIRIRVVECHRGRTEEGNGTWRSYISLKFLKGRLTVLNECLQYPMDG